MSAFVLMSRARANAILDELRAGVADYPADVVRLALYLTGDLAASGAA